MRTRLKIFALSSHSVFMRSYEAYNRQRLFPYITSISWSF